MWRPSFPSDYKPSLPPFYGHTQTAFPSTSASLALPPISRSYPRFLSQPYRPCSWRLGCPRTRCGSPLTSRLICPRYRLSPASLCRRCGKWNTRIDQHQVQLENERSSLYTLLQINTNITPFWISRGNRTIELKLKKFQKLGTWEVPLLLKYLILIVFLVWAWDKLKYT